MFCMARKIARLAAPLLIYHILARFTYPGKCKLKHWIMKADNPMSNSFLAFGYLDLKKEEILLRRWRVRRYCLDCSHTISFTTLCAFTKLLGTCVLCRIKRDEVSLRRTTGRALRMWTTCQWWLYCRWMRFWIFGCAIQPRQLWANSALDPWCRPRAGIHLIAEFMKLWWLDFQKKTSDTPRKNV
jgi:hypothetical protein